MTFTARACEALKNLLVAIEEKDNPSDMGLGVTDPVFVEARKTLEYLQSEGCCE